MTADWRAALEDARRPRSPKQRAWDVQFDRQLVIASRTIADPNQATAVAYTRTEDQHGQRPKSTKETDR